MNNYKITDTGTNTTYTKNEKELFSLAGYYMESLNNELEGDEKEYVINNLSDVIDILEVVNIYVGKERL